MNYRNRKVEINKVNLMQFIRQLAGGKFLIPTFQRLFVWSPDNIAGLWKSVFQCYPVGSILCWKTAIQLHVHRLLGGFYIPEKEDRGRNTRLYILDGQQRATALMASFYGGTGKVRENSSFDYTLYFDLIGADFFFQKDYYRHRWNADPEFLVRLGEVPELPDDYGRRLESLPGFCPAVTKNLEQLKYMFTDYRIPVIMLEGFDIGNVCEVYERINQTGIRLENMDILIARSFKNYDTVVEEDFPER